MLTFMAILTRILAFCKTYWKQLLLVILGSILTLKVQGCARKLFPSKNPVSGPTTPISKPSPLPKDDKEEVKVDADGTTTIITDKGTTVVNNTRGATVEVKKDGTVKVTEKTYGFCHNVVVGPAVNSTGVKGTIGLEWAFYKKLDLISGVGADKYLSHSALFTSIGYVPKTKIFKNTSFWIGGSVDLRGEKSGMVGVSTRI